jgi:Type II CAAX prenyl endopeptidase Rce1-like
MRRGGCVFRGFSCFGWGYLAPLLRVRARARERGCSRLLQGGLLLVMFLFNTTLGEELLFRGYLLPRMNGAFGRGDWVANGILFAGYHLHVPWVIPASLLDTFILAYPSKRYHSLDRDRRPHRAKRCLRGPRRDARHLNARLPRRQPNPVGPSGSQDLAFQAEVPAVEARPGTQTTHRRPKARVRYPAAITRSAASWHSLAR